LNGPLKRLQELNIEARQLLNNGSANPNEFNEYSAHLLDALNEARPLNVPQNNEGLMPALRQAITDAEQTKSALDELWKKWQPVRKSISQIETTQNESNANPLQTIKAKGLRPLNEAKEDLDELKVSNFN
jgi:hypothetical protein